jgi:hypothetical protein
MMSLGVDIAIASTGLTERLGDLALDSEHEIGAGPREREVVCVRRALAAREGGTLCSGMPSSIS